MCAMGDSGAISGMGGVDGVVVLGIGWRRRTVLIVFGHWLTTRFLLLLVIALF